MNYGYSSTRSGLSKAKNLGSAKSGTHHWVMQRISSILLVFLYIWFVYFCIKIGGTDHKYAIEQAKLPYNFLALILFLSSGIYHGMLGMQVIIEDYISLLPVRFVFLITLKIFSFVTLFALIYSAIYFMINHF